MKRSAKRICVLFACCVLGIAGRTHEALAAVADTGAQPLSIDPRPFGHHPATAFGLAGDPYLPAKEARLAWTRDGGAPYLFWALVDPNRTGDPAKMIFAGVAAGPDRIPASFDYDKGINDAIASGLNVMWNIAVEPTNMGYQKPGSWLPVDESAYVSFVKTAVKRYAGVRVWQVGNEPNLGATRALRDLAKLQKLTYDAVKEADPSAMVALAGVGGGGTMSSLTDAFFDTVLDELAGCCVDVFDFHFYGDPKGGTLSHALNGDRMVGYADFEAAAKFYRSHLDARGFTTTRLWTTENGTFSGTIKVGLDTITTTEAEQARDLPKRTVVALAAGVDKLFWAWGMTEGFGPWDDDFFDHTGLLYDGHGAPLGTKKLAYYALWQMTRQLEGCESDQIERIDTNVPETRAYRCRRAGGGDIVAAWWDTFNTPGYTAGQMIELTIPWGGPTAVQRAGVPNAVRGAEVTEPATAFVESTLVPQNGTVTLTLGADPVYVRPEVSTQLITGKKLRLSDKQGDAVKRKLVVVSTDPSISSPALEDADAPTTSGGSLEIINPTTGETGAFSLPAAHWKGIGTPAGSQGYRYSDTRRAAGPCRTLRIRNGQRRCNLVAVLRPERAAGPRPHQHPHFLARQSALRLESAGTERRLGRSQRA